ncbi:hypothetical protein L873DRAFT_1794517 [Choiromyces venosus 120613-1]|uniref:SAP domain-containing protein n=1 Tax=Choiromyces venosus 120613-1 TaxID=1336337 RepID=A0A3N4J6I3_9PEZI|nr:hypothetical protein L873DRAFT_1794517 [Choiromyces venosus 120613-1]
MPPKSTKVEDLRGQCKSAGLDTTGNKADLVKPLKGQKNREELSPEDQDDPKCDAILFTKSETGSEEEMKYEAKDALGQVLQEEELEVEKVRGEPFVGNRRARGLTGIGERMGALEERASALQDEINLLWDDVSTLKLCVPEYSRVRNRFISTFKLDKLNNTTESDMDIIRQGNIQWHMKEMLLLMPCSHRETINILNIHAGVRADSHKTGTDEFYQKFAEFIQLFERSGCDESYLTARSQCADIARAYWLLLGCQRYKDRA